MKPIQLFDETSCTYTYILWDETSLDAVIIDPVDEQLERDLNVLQEHKLNLQWIIETHAHADHITSAWRLAEHTHAKTATPIGCHVGASTRQLQDNDQITFGQESILALHTPGHTAGSMSFVWRDMVFTGDTLLINGCGRTDFQSGSAHDLYHSITTRLFMLPDKTIIYPGHDYQGKTQSTIGHEKKYNPRLAHKSQEEFVAIMHALNLPKPKRIQEAVPANLHLGLRHDADGVALFEPALDYAGNISPQQAFEWWQNGSAQLVDVRTDAEIEWVGFVPNAQIIAFKTWPNMTLNPEFEQKLLSDVKKEQPVLFLCRTGVRAIAAAQQATKLGYTAYNVTGGFEGELNEHAQRGQLNGWCACGLPWRQS